MKKFANNIAPISIAALALLALTAPGASAHVASASESPEAELPEHIETQLEDTSDYAYVFYAPEVDVTSTEESWTQIAPDALDNGV